MKSSIRKQILQKRDELSKNERVEKDEVIFEQLIPYLNHARCVGIYKNFSSEVDTQEIITFLLENDKTVCVPKCFSDHKMLFYGIDEQTTFQENHIGIQEPINMKEINPDNIDLMIIPMVAYQGKDRLGYGGGFYDRYLQNCDAYKIGIAYTCQEATFDVNEFDIPMDIIIHD